MTITIRAPRNTDAATLQLREIDRLEVWAMNRQTPQAALEKAFKVSDKCWVVEQQGKPIAAFGVAPFAEGIGCPWLLAADEAEAIPLTFLRTTKRYLAELAADYDQLMNFVHQENTKSQQWLEWLGFTLGYSIEVNGEAFIQFSRSTPCAA